MTNTFSLTDKETQALILFTQSCLDGMGGKRPSDLEDDTYTWISEKDLTRGGFSKHQAAGLISSLSEKGVIYEYEPNQWVLADEGFRFADTIWDKQKTQQVSA